MDCEVDQIGSGQGLICDTSEHGSILPPSFSSRPRTSRRRTNYIN